MSDDFHDAFAILPDLETGAEDGAADEWLHDTIVRMAVARFGPGVVVTVSDAAGARSYPLLSFEGDLALRGAWDEMTVAFGRPGERPVRLARAAAPPRS
jgi:hypothetical protein